MRWVTAAERRPEITASSIPNTYNIFKPWPSRERNTLFSRPASSKCRPPSVSTPSTSKITRRIWAALSNTVCMTTFRLAPDSYHSRAQEVVHAERADQCAGVVDHQEAVDLRTVHDLRSLGGQYVRVYRLAVARHHLADTRAVHVELVIHRAAQVDVGEAAHHLARLVDHRRHALAADLEQGLAEFHLGRDRGHRRAAAHYVFHVQQQAPAETAAGVRARKIFAHEPARLQQCDRKRIAHRERGGEAHRKNKNEQTRLLRHTHVDVRIGE